YLPQNAPGFANTVRDMLNYCAPKPYADETLTEVLKTVGLYDDLAPLGGLEYEIGDGGERLSGGQRQKLGVARLLLCDTPYVLMDEATSALDVEATAALQEAIDKATKGRTLLTVAHDLTTVKNADRILVFDGGRIEASGTHEELLQSSPTYRLLWKEVQAA
ncbi:MAG: ATP-binding cassette domain-containing protein, partial [Clostridia bacterium]|nr:ATP-binding cassette domain-containing protein [Clostridia bacterium]